MILDYEQKYKKISLGRIEALSNRLRQSKIQSRMAPVEESGPEKENPEVEIKPSESLDPNEKQVDGSPLNPGSPMAHDKVDHPNVHSDSHDHTHDHVHIDSSTDRLGSSSNSDFRTETRMDAVLDEIKASPFYEDVPADVVKPPENEAQRVEKDEPAVGEGAKDDVEQASPAQEPTRPESQPIVQVGQNDSTGPETTDAASVNHVLQTEPISNETSESATAEASTESTPRPMHVTVTSVNVHTSQKYCADLNQIKRLFDQHIDPIYMPLIDLLPSEFQVALRDETQFAGLSRAACLFVSAVVALVMGAWYVVSRVHESRRVNVSVRLNEQLLAAANHIKRLEFENKAFAGLVADWEAKQAKADEREARARELERTLHQTSEANELLERDAKKLRASEAKLAREVGQLKMDLAALTETCTRQKVDYEMEMSEMALKTNARVLECTEQLAERDARLRELEQEMVAKSARVDALTEVEAALREDIEAKESTIAILKNSLVIKTSPPAKGYETGRPTRT